MRIDKYSRVNIERMDLDKGPPGNTKHTRYKVIWGKHRALEIIPLLMLIAVVCWIGVWLYRNTYCGVCGKPTSFNNESVVRERGHVYHKACLGLPDENQSTPAITPTPRQEVTAGESEAGTAGEDVVGSTDSSEYEDPAQLERDKFGEPQNNDIVDNIVDSVKDYLGGSDKDGASMFDPNVQDDGNSLSGVDEGSVWGRAED